MRSIFTRRNDSARFSTSWRGYNRAEVDEFVRQTEIDRQRLQEDLAQLTAVMATSGGERRELERLAAVRREVASCLETSIGALRTATGLLGGGATTPPQIRPPAPATPPEPAPIRVDHLMASLRLLEAPAPPPRSLPALPKWRTPSLRNWRTLSLPNWTVLRSRPVVAGGGLAAVLLFAGFMYQNEPSANEMPQAPVTAVKDVPQVEQVAPAPVPVEDAVPAAPIAERVDGLVLTLTARRNTWIGTTLDGGQRLERLLHANETIMLRATNEAILRVGDATALSVLINNQPTRPLGTTGQVVTTRITSANYKNLLLN